MQKLLQQKTSFKNRWYELNPVISEGIRLWEHFPPTLQSALGLYLRTFIKRNNIKTVGLFQSSRHQLRSRMMSHQKRRWYDKDPNTRWTMNTLSQVDSKTVIGIAEKIMLLNAYWLKNSPDLLTASQRDWERVVEAIFENKRMKRF